MNLPNLKKTTSFNSNLIGVQSQYPNDFEKTLQYIAAELGITYENPDQFKVNITEIIHSGSMSMAEVYNVFSGYMFGEFGVDDDLLDYLGFFLKNFLPIEEWDAVLEDFSDEHYHYQNKLMIMASNTLPSIKNNIKNESEDVLEDIRRKGIGKLEANAALEKYPQYLTNATERNHFVEALKPHLGVRLYNDSFMENKKVHKEYGFEQLEGVTHYILGADQKYNDIFLHAYSAIAKAEGITLRQVNEEFQNDFPGDFQSYILSKGEINFESIAKKEIPSDKYYQIKESLENVLGEFKHPLLEEIIIFNYWQVNDLRDEANVAPELQMHLAKIMSGQLSNPEQNQFLAGYYLVQAYIVNDFVRKNYPLEDQKEVSLALAKIVKKENYNGFNEIINTLRKLVPLNDASLRKENLIRVSEKSSSRVNSIVKSWIRSSGAPETRMTGSLGSHISLGFEHLYRPFYHSENNENQIGTYMNVRTKLPLENNPRFGFELGGGFFANWQAFRLQTGLGFQTLNGLSNFDVAAKLEVGVDLGDPAGTLFFGITEGFKEREWGVTYKLTLNRKSNEGPLFQP